MLKQCPTCSQDISLEAMTCPKCGKTDPFGVHTARTQEQMDAIKKRIPFMIILSLVSALIFYLLVDYLSRTL